jgi:hypothetical protein
MQNTYWTREHLEKPIHREPCQINALESRQRTTIHLITTINRSLYYSNHAEFWFVTKTDRQKDFCAAEPFFNNIRSRFLWANGWRTDCWTWKTVHSKYPPQMTFGKSVSSKIDLYLTRVTQQGHGRPSKVSSSIDGTYTYRLPASCIDLISPEGEVEIP